MEIDADLELPSWRPGPTRDAIATFLEEVKEVPPHLRVAVFDNDGTLWNERPTYVQSAFFEHSYAARLADDPTFDPGEVTRDVIVNGPDAIAKYSVSEIVTGLNSLFLGLTPAEFNALVRGFVRDAKHDDYDISPMGLRYQPMLELLTALRARAFDCFIVTGGGTEFVRAVSWEAYEVPEDRVVGTTLDYRVVYDEADVDRRKPIVIRDGTRPAVPNEGEQKLIEIQQFIGRQPILAAGNSAGDLEMLDFVYENDGPALGLLIDHDDAEREYSYASVAASFDDQRSIVEIAADRPWVVVSIRDDWAKVFPEEPTRSATS